MSITKNRNYSWAYYVWTIKPEEYVATRKKIRYLVVKSLMRCEVGARLSH